MRAGHLWVRRVDIDTVDAQGVDRQLSLICDRLVELVRPTGILARNDAHVRALEGLPRWSVEGIASTRSSSIT